MSNNTSKSRQQMRREFASSRDGFESTLEAIESKLRLLRQELRQADPSAAAGALVADANTALCDAVWAFGLND
jgi:septation ring formation regulator EzrA